MGKKIVIEHDISDKVILYRLFFNCELMYDYLTETGKKVSPWIGVSLSGINLKTSKLKTEYVEKIKNIEMTKEKEFELHCQIAELIAGDKEELTKMFNELSSLCAPATPCTLENTIPKAKLFKKFGPMFMPFIRDIWFISIICLIGYIVCSAINAYKPDSNYNFQFLLMFSAALGACFYTLNTTKRYVVNRTFDNYYIESYYSRIIIGVIAGIILANIIQANYFPVPKTGTNLESKILFQMTPSLFALLGGFSAEAVVKILNRLVAMIMTLVEGETKDLIDSRVQELKNKMETNNIKQNIQNVSDLQAILNSSSLKADEDVTKKVKEIINRLLEGK